MSASVTRAGLSVRGLSNWILDYSDQASAEVTNMALNKLIFFAVERFLIHDRILLTNAKIEAWEHGPVFREVYQSFKAFGDRPIKARSSFFSVISNTMEVAGVDIPPTYEAKLDCLLAPLIHKKAAELRGVSHVKDGAWHRVWWYEGHANPGMEITPESIIEISEGR